MFMLNELLIKDLSVQVDTNTSDIQCIKEAEVHSTNEVKTNKVWIDGKPIYRKVIRFTNSNTDWGSIDVITDLDEIVILSGYVYDSGNNKTVIPSYGNDSVSIYITQGGSIRKKATSYYQNKSGVLLIEYTKTTD